MLFRTGEGRATYVFRYGEKLHSYGVTVKTVGDP